MKKIITLLIVTIIISGCGPSKDSEDKSAVDQFIEDATGKTKVDGFQQTKQGLGDLNVKHNERLKKASEATE